ncbi:hypothetical protein NUW54_g1013 [Trametes sanguinea]|uniref:Uncharacterized protein n=1 Tax=Trametes sanguinea TaxID=158606 RepID=A0ACC1Q8W1_9APHY|nr:hypothetical protein NUW54_g1013 [Trametes sanguinea]
MYLPTAAGFRYLLHARCALLSYAEAHPVHRETSKVIAQWIFQELLCQWGTLVEIVTDNGTPFDKALKHLDAKYGIWHVRISGYNPQANGVIEHPHFDIRQALFKAVNGDQSKWLQYIHHILLADRITVQWRMGCSPYFAVMGRHPILPCDVVEATYLIPPPSSRPSMTELTAARAWTLAHHQEDLVRLHSPVIKEQLKAAR